MQREKPGERALGGGRKERKKKTYTEDDRNRGRNTEIKRERKNTRCRKKKL